MAMNSVPLQPSLLALLESTPRRETAGELAANRFDYQKYWTLFLILKLHASSRQYAVIPEFHDDIAVLDNMLDPEDIVFYQVKTRDKHWTLSDITTSDKPAANANTTTTKPTSMVAKLYHNIQIFGSHVSACYFVTNAEFRCSLYNKIKTDGLKEFKLSELEKFSKVVSSVQESCHLNEATIRTAPVKVIVTEILLNGYEEQLTGIIAAFLNPGLLAFSSLLSLPHKRWSQR